MSQIKATKNSTRAKRVGYTVGVGFNVALLVVVNNLLAWGWFPWLTPAFQDVLPILNVALVVNIVVYVVYMFYDEAWLKALTQILVNVLAIVVLVWMLVVYPFDFSAHDFPVEISAFDLSWDLVARLVIGLAIFGTAVAVVTEIVKLVRATNRHNGTMR